MNRRRRKVAAPGLRSRRVPARSRVTVRRSEAPLLRSTNLATALRDSRAALSSLEGELDAILKSLRTSDGAPEMTAANRLARRHPGGGGGDGLPGRFRPRR